MFTEEQLKEMRETANKNEKDQIFWKEADGTTKLTSTYIKEAK